MADNINIEIIKQLDEALKAGKISAEQYTLAINHMKKQTLDVVARLGELGKKTKQESDTIKIRNKLITDEIETIKRSAKTKEEKASEEILLRSKVISSMKDATAAQKVEMENAFSNARALLISKERQTIFNESLASTKNYLLPLGAAAADAARSLASNLRGNPLEAGAALTVKSAEKAGQGLSVAGTAANSLGQTLMQSTNKYAKITGGAFQGLGFVANATGSAVKLAGEALSTITPIVSGYVSTFKKATEAGAVFGGGMSELRNMAGSLGVKMDDLVGGVERSQDAFFRGGLNFQQATKTVSQFGKGLVKGNEANQLFALGFTEVSDRIALSGQAFEQLRSRGLSEADARLKLTETTLQYGKDLKVLQGIAGKNAEKELEKARLETQRGALMSKLSAEQKNVYEGAYTTLDGLGSQADKARTALTQLAAGGVITDPDILVNEPMRKMLESINQQIQIGAATIQDGAKSTQVLMSEAAKAALGPEGQLGRTLDSAYNQLGRNVDGIISGGALVYNALVAYKASVNQGQEVQDSVNAKIDPTTRILAYLTSSAASLQSKLEQIATKGAAIDFFAKVIGEANQSIETLVGFIDKTTGGGHGNTLDTTSKVLAETVSSPSTWLAAATIIGTSAAASIGSTISKVIPAASAAYSSLSSTAGNLAGTAISKVGSAAGYTKEVISIGKAGASTLAGSAGAQGAAALASANSALATQGGATLLKNVPYLGGLISGAMEFANSGNVGKSLVKGAGTVAGGAIGAVGGSALGPVGTFAGGAAGSIAGEQVSGALYDWVESFFTKKSSSGVGATPIETSSSIGPHAMKFEDVTKTLVASNEENRKLNADTLYKTQIALVDSMKKEMTNTAGAEKVIEINDGVRQMVLKFDEMIDQMRNVSSNTRQTALAVG